MFKNVKGEFIKRRVNKMITNANKNGLNHSDDLGIAGFNIEEVKDGISDSES